METLTKQCLKINTDVLQELVSKAVKACSFIEMLPLTSLMRLQCKDNKLTLTTTDDVNILKLQIIITIIFTKKHEPFAINFLNKLLKNITQNIL